MPDSGAEVSVPVTVSHTSTPQWQSFEIRMRHRRAERCLAHANLALSAGLLDEARAAGEEARALAPGMPELEELEQKLAASLEEVSDAISTAPAGDVLLAPFEPTDSFRHEKKGGSGVYARAVVVAASLALLGTGVVSWYRLTASAPRTVAESVVPGDQRLMPEGSTEPVPEPAPEPAGLQSGTGPAETAPAQPPAASRPEAAPISTPGMSDAPTDRSLASQATPTSGLIAGRAAVPPAPLPPPSRTVTPLETTSAPNRDPRPSLPSVSTLPSVRPGASAVRDSVPPPKPPTIDAVPLATAELTATGSVPMSAPVAAPTVRPRAAEAVPAADPRTAVRAVLARYEAAFSGLDVGAARAVWPSVDDRALSRAFDGLSAQRIALERCDVTVAGSTARAACSGTAEWTPKVGGGQRRQSRRWAFDLADAGGAWKIVRADAR